MPDPNATAYWWTPDILAGSFPAAVSFNGGAYSLGSHDRPGQFSIVAVPEPSTWAMIPGGFASVGWAASRTRGKIARRRASLRIGAALGHGERVSRDNAKLGVIVKEPQATRNSGDAAA
jgi:hypothetical protein